MEKFNYKTAVKDSTVIAVEKNNKVIALGYFQEIVLDKKKSWVRFTKSKKSESKSRGMFIEPLSSVRKATEEEKKSLL